MLLLPGSILENRFEILAAVGVGGMGHVYKARQLSLDRVVALKCLNLGETTDGDSYSRLEREAQALSQISHKNIVSIYGLQRMSGSPYIVMEYVDGNSLSSYLSQNGAVPLDLFEQIALSLCNALSCAHACGVVHRDVKPSNVLITKLGEIKLLDFGLAKLLPEYGRSVQQLTEAGMAVGSVLYMSPEQCTASGCDQRSDIYSLGCLLYHCLTGEPPFDGDHSVVVMNCHLTKMPPRLPDSSGSSKFVSAIQAVLDRAMQKSPDDRYQDTLELRHDLERCFAGKTVRTNASFLAQSPDGGKMGDPHHSAAPLVVAALVALMFSGYFVWTLIQQEMNARQIAALQETTENADATYMRTADRRLSRSEGSTELAQLGRSVLRSWMRIIAMQKKAGQSTDAAYRHLERAYPAVMLDTDDPGERVSMSWDILGLPDISDRSRAQIRGVLAGTLSGHIAGISLEGDYKKAIESGRRFYDVLREPGPDEASAWVQSEFISAWSNALDADHQSGKAVDVAIRWSQQCSAKFPNSLADAKSQMQIAYLTKHNRPEVARKAVQGSIYAIKHLTKIPIGASDQTVEDLISSAVPYCRLGLLDGRELREVSRIRCGDRGQALTELALDLPGADVTMKRYLSTLPEVKPGQLHCMLSLCDWYHRHGRFDESSLVAAQLSKAVPLSGAKTEYALLVQLRASLMQAQNEYRMGHYEQAMALANAAMENDPDASRQAQVKYIRGLIFFSEDKLDLATRDLEEAFEFFWKQPVKDSRTANSAAALSHLSYKRGDYRSARKYNKLAMDEAEKTRDKPLLLELRKMKAKLVDK